MPFNPVPLLLGCLLCFGIRIEKKESAGAHTALLALLLTLAGYFFAYLVTYQPLEWHLATSCDRLLLQLWPSFLFLAFFALPGPRQLLPRPQEREGSA